MKKIITSCVITLLCLACCIRLIDLMFMAKGEVDAFDLVVPAALNLLLYKTYFSINKGE